MNFTPSRAYEDNVFFQIGPNENKVNNDGTDGCYGNLFNTKIFTRLFDNAVA